MDSFLNLFRKSIKHSWNVKIERITHDSVTVSWNYVKDIDTYMITLTDKKINIVEISKEKDCTQLITGLQERQKYCLKVHAVTKDGKRSTSSRGLFFRTPFQKIFNIEMDNDRFASPIRIIPSSITGTSAIVCWTNERYRSVSMLSTCSASTVNSCSSFFTTTYSIVISSINKNNIHSEELIDLIYCGCSEKINGLDPKTQYSVAVFRVFDNGNEIEKEPIDEFYFETIDEQNSKKLPFQKPPNFTKDWIDFTRGIRT